MNFTSTKAFCSFYFGIQVPTCQPGEFECGNGSCISKDFVCDRFPDCSDGTDEEETLCATCPFMFLCTNGRCKDLEYVCDGTNNCEDNSDEDQICVGTPFELICKGISEAQDLPF